MFPLGLVQTFVGFRLECGRELPFALGPDMVMTFKVVVHCVEWMVNELRHIVIFTIDLLNIISTIYLSLRSNHSKYC